MRCLAVPMFGIGDEDVERILPEMLRISAALSGDCTSSMSNRSTAPEG